MWQYPMTMMFQTCLVILEPWWNIHALMMMMSWWTVCWWRGCLATVKDDQQWRGWALEIEDRRITVHNANEICWTWHDQWYAEHAQWYVQYTAQIYWMDKQGWWYDVWHALKVDIQSQACYPKVWHALVKTLMFQTFPWQWWWWQSSEVSPRVAATRRGWLAVKNDDKRRGWAAEVDKQNHEQT